VLGGIATTLIVLWFLGLFVFHIASALVHVALIVGVILLVLNGACPSRS
jgi:hypothetical protein